MRRDPAAQGRRRGAALRDEDPRSLRTPHPHLSRDRQPVDAHDQGIKAFAQRNRITLVFTSTYASFLNRIECNFAAYKDFVVNGSDFDSHDELIVATRSYLRYRNHRRKGTLARQAEKRRKIA